MKTILCIDDDPIRYTRFNKTYLDVQVIVTCRLEEVRFYLEGCRTYNIIGICLDHDMPYVTGDYFARYLLNDYPDIPVVITSNNLPGAETIESILLCQAGRTRETVVRSPANTREEWPIKVINYFQDRIT